MKKIPSSAFSNRLLVLTLVSYLYNPTITSFKSHPLHQLGEHGNKVADPLLQ